MTDEIFTGIVDALRKLPLTEDCDPTRVILERLREIGWNQPPAVIPPPTLFADGRLNALPESNWAIEFLAANFILTTKDPKMIAYTIDGVTMSHRIPKISSIEQIQWAENKGAELIALEVVRADNTTTRHKFTTVALIDFKQAKLNTNKNAENN